MSGLFWLRGAASCLRWVCAILLWASAVIHTANPLHFYGVVLDYDVLPRGLASMAAAGLPWLQMLIAGLLVFWGGHHEFPALGLIGLGLLFVVVQGIAAFRGLAIDCGCFGDSQTPIGLRSFLLASVLVIGGVVNLVYHRRPIVGD